MKLITIIGARPQFIKAAIVSKSLQDTTIKEVIIHSGQHYDKYMSDIFFSEMEIIDPRYKLNINQLNQGSMTGRMIEHIEKILLDESPDYIMVYGDTNTTLAGALSARKLNIGVIHVEAGLRSFNMEMPEEINRILTDRMSEILFCPTTNALKNLKREGYENFNTRIIMCGDVMEDAATFFSDISERYSNIIQETNLNNSEYILCTIHRAENTDNPVRLKQLVNALNYLAEDYEIILPLHPRTKAKLELEKLQLNIRIIEPVGYLDMVSLLKNCSIVMTDSGGLQKEAYFFNKYCLTLRDETEWVELVDNGFNYLVGTDQGEIIKRLRALLSQDYNKTVQLYGGGEAAIKIVETLESL